MRILFDEVSSDYRYPLTSSEVKNVMRSYAEDVTSKVRNIRFGCNQTTTQEGRLVTRGSSYDIRINFCLLGDTSRKLADTEGYLKFIRELGGKVSEESNLIEWPGDSAKRYAIFILFHELTHIQYNAEWNSSLYGKGTPKEEEYCDKEALKLAKAFEF